MAGKLVELRLAEVRVRVRARARVRIRIRARARARARAGARVVELCLAEVVGIAILAILATKQSVTPSDDRVLARPVTLLAPVRPPGCGFAWRLLRLDLCARSSSKGSSSRRIEVGCQAKTGTGRHR